MGYGINRSPETISAAVAQTVGWSSAELPGSPPQGPFLKRFFPITTGANNHLTSAVTRIRIKANGQEIWNIPSAHLRAYVEAMAPANTIPPAARLRFTIPQDLLGRYTRDQYACAFPIGAAPGVEFDCDANASAGTAIIAWETARTRPTHWTKFLSKASNIGASVALGRINIELPPGELLYGIALPIVGATGILAARLYVGNVKEAELTQEGILESQFLENPQTVTTSYFWRFDEPLVLSPMQGSNYLEVETGAGSAVSDQYSFMTLVQQPQIQ